ncbi:ATP-binding cassette sub-family G member 4-like isoform X2 [Rhopilema esculentum]|uniref:ATP-binding cassette sub-family G member 4-like isoform X2 n=1 Tax=Rhopilema esculentum TaxID=499914 RepID=UPI0031CEA19C|eukprot:gene16441-7854_t
MKALCATGKKKELQCCGNGDTTSCCDYPFIATDPAKCSPVEPKSVFSGPNFKVDIEFKEVGFAVKLKGRENKVILNNVSGKFQSGELTAVIGPSGAGKSTLLNILAGYNSRSAEGKILVNGVKRDARNFRKISCYIMQDDILMPNLTVLESMMVSASLHLKESNSKEQKKQGILDILSVLGLEETADTYLHEISGGQRKRLAIALELVNNPPVIFLDEPTSGLDSLSAYQCISLMKTLAKGGRTVICTIHQPSAKLFEMFDKLYILTSGQCIYSGSLNDLLPYMESQGLRCPKYHNPADFVIEVASGEYGDVTNHLVKSWKIQEKKNELAEMEKQIHSQDAESKYDKSFALPAVVTYMPGKCTSVTSSSESLLDVVSQTTQFSVLIKRSMVSIFRDRMFTHLRLISTIAVAFLIGLLYYKIGNNGDKVINNTGCLFFSMLFLMFIALMPTVLTFPLEKLVFIREHLNNWYSLKSYYLAKTMADLPFQIILPALYCTIIYFMTNQPKEPERFVQFLVITILTCLVSQSIGLLLGAVAPSVPTAVFVAPVTGIPVLLFSGFFVNFDTIPTYMQWLTYISFARYSWEGTIVAIYGNNRGSLDCDKPRCIFKSSQEVLEAMDVSEDALFLDNAKFHFDCIVLGFFFISLRLITYLVLRYKVKSTTS